MCASDIYGKEDSMKDTIDAIAAADLRDSVKIMTGERQTDKQVRQ
jgi:methanogenic corrinoid protein MtbC1